jgi:uncharacterized protein YfaP (DUF2135 family)
VELGLEIRLHWVGRNDLDLVVIDPRGEVLSFSQTRTSSGGAFIKDSNANCLYATSAEPTESARWKSMPIPSGEYNIYVDFYEQCGGREMVPFEVSVIADGQEQIFTGVVKQERERQLVTTFEYLPREVQ